MNDKLHNSCHNFTKIKSSSTKSTWTVFFVTNGVLLFITPGTVYLVSHVLGQSTWYHRYRDCVLVSHVLEQCTWYRRVSQTSPDDSCSLTLRIQYFGVVYLESLALGQWTWYCRGPPASPDDSCSLIYAYSGTVYLVSQRVPDQPGWQLQPDSMQSPWDPQSSEQAAETRSCVTIYSRTQTTLKG